MAKNSFSELTEYVCSTGRALAVDAAAGVVRGVKLLGLTSGNGREYLPEALASARSLYEGAKVNIDHVAKAGDPRSYSDRFGVVKNVSVAADGLYGDIHYNPKHPLAERFAWDAANEPSNVGMSHDVIGRTSTKGGKLIVEEIKKVRSVDIVADPATTRGLFESVKESDEMELEQLKEQVAKLTGDVTNLVAKNTALQEQLDAANKAKDDADKAVAESARKAAINAAFTEHKVDRSKVPAGLLSIIESQSAEAAKEAIKGLAETKSVAKSAAAESFGITESAGQQTESIEDWAKRMKR